MKLKTEIFLLLFITGLAVIVITGTLYYFNAKKSTTTHLKNQLESLSETKKLQLETMLSKKQEELQQILNNTLLKQRLNLFCKEQKSGDPRLHDSFKILIYNQISRAVSDQKSFRKIHILDSTGKVIISTDPKINNQNFSEFECFKLALKRQTYSHAFIQDSIPYFCLSGPLFIMKDLLGIVIIETELEDLPGITGDYTGLGYTGETTIAQKINDTAAVFLTPMRFQPKFSAIEKRRRNETQATFLALSGNEAFLENAEDYRQQEVIASVRHISPTGWGLTTKMDISEAMAPVREFKTMSLKIALISLIVLAIIAFIFANKIVKPINSISEAAQKISAGDLLMQVSINKNNELGNLASCFNTMTKSLVAAQQQLQTKVQEINRSNVSLEKFAYIVSHDLKAPLNSISSLTDIIISENNNKLEAEGVKMLGMLQTKVKQMHSLINGILEYSKVDHTNESIERVDLNNTIAQVIENLSPSPKVSIDIIGELPEIEFEKILIFQVFQNLLSNAIKYSYRQQIKIQVGHEIDGKFYKFFVADNGMGIDERYLVKIFEIFTTLQPKGSDSTGIGLAIVKKIIENKGGAIYATSKVREGSTFYFTLPI